MAFERLAPLSVMEPGTWLCLAAGSPSLLVSELEQEPGWLLVPRSWDWFIDTVGEPSQEFGLSPVTNKSSCHTLVATAVPWALC